METASRRAAADIPVRLEALYAALGDLVDEVRAALAADDLTAAALAVAHMSTLSTEVHALVREWNTQARILSEASASSITDR
jgi:hypothetical protein